MFHVEQKILNQFNISDEIFDRLVLYEEILKKWQRSINIVSRETLKDFWNRHILDSLQIIKYINGKSILDIGSGGGFPGMVVAICTDLQVTCLDSDYRKILFLEEVSRQTKTNVNILNIRIESLNSNEFDVICARGFAKLSKLVSLTLKHSKNLQGIFLKGKAFETELKEALKFFDFKYILHDSLNDKRGKIIVLNNIVKKITSSN